MNVSSVVLLLTLYPTSSLIAATVTDVENIPATAVDTAPLFNRLVSQFDLESPAYHKYVVTQLPTILNQERLDPRQLRLCAALLNSLQIYIPPSQFLNLRKKLDHLQLDLEKRKSNSGSTKKRIPLKQIVVIQNTVKAHNKVSEDGNPKKGPLTKEIHRLRRLE